MKVKKSFMFSFFNKHARLPYSLEIRQKFKKNRIHFSRHWVTFLKVFSFVQTTPPTTTIIFDFYTNHKISLMVNLFKSKLDQQSKKFQLSFFNTGKISSTFLDVEALIIHITPPIPIITCGT